MLLGRLFGRRKIRSGPGAVVITCGCQSSDECPQFRMLQSYGSHPKGCAIRMDELDLIRITNDMVEARFKATRETEK